MELRKRCRSSAGFELHGDGVGLRRVRESQDQCADFLVDDDKAGMMLGLAIREHGKRSVIDGLGAADAEFMVLLDGW